MSFALGHLGLGLCTHDTATPVLTGLLVLVVEVGLDGLGQGGQVVFVLWADLRQGNGRGSLLVDQGTEGSLALDDAIRNAHLAAQGGQPHDQFDRIDVMRDDDQGGLLGFDQGSYVVQAVFDAKRLLGLLSLLSRSLGSSNLGQALLLLSLCFGDVLLQQGEELGAGVLVQCLGELVNGRGDLQTLLKNGTLALQADIDRPLDITRQVALRLDVVTDGKVTGTLLE